MRFSRGLQQVVGLLFPELFVQVKYLKSGQRGYAEIESLALNQGQLYIPRNTILSSRKMQNGIEIELQPSIYMGFDGTLSVTFCNPQLKQKSSPQMWALWRQTLDQIRQIDHIVDHDIVVCSDAAFFSALASSNRESRAAPDPSF